MENLFVMDKKNELLVKMFNKVFKTGDIITLRDDSGDPFQAKVKLGALILPFQNPVINVEPDDFYAITRLILD